ncbi:hypothetical protein HDU80_003368 [Chytriomyces hyalinus]|nr:hypothetical protein HDU80_003368 [Chytriomyces hyalinus]
MNAHCDQASPYESPHQRSDASACECCSALSASDAATANATLLNASTSAFHPTAAAQHSHSTHQHTLAVTHIDNTLPTSTNNALFPTETQFLHQQFFAEPAEAETVTHSDSLLQSLLDAVEGVDSSDALNQLVAMALLVASARVEVNVVHAGNVPPAAD